ncbi:MAG: hypothetical protein ACI4V5_04650 [Prevotella sp.]
MFITQKRENLMTVPELSGARSRTGHHHQFCRKKLAQMARFPLPTLEDLRLQTCPQDFLPHAFKNSPLRT